MITSYPTDQFPIPGKSIRQIAEEKAKENPPKPVDVIIPISKGIISRNGKFETVDHTPPNGSVK